MTNTITFTYLNIIYNPPSFIEKQTTAKGPRIFHLYTPDRVKIACGDRVWFLEYNKCNTKGEVNAGKIAKRYFDWD
jgi:hypothetical protein